MSREQLQTSPHGWRGAARGVREIGHQTPDAAPSVAATSARLGSVADCRNARRGPRGARAVTDLWRGRTHRAPTLRAIVGMNRNEMLAIRTAHQVLARRA
jgi:hypothetical protein